MYACAYFSHLHYQLGEGLGDGLEHVRGPALLFQVHGVDDEPREPLQVVDATSRGSSTSTLSQLNMS